MKKVNILFKFVDGPWGGGNQFLKTLKNQFQAMNIYEEEPESADIIIFNSYPFGSEYLYDKAFKLLRQYPGKTLIHRVDGPISLVRGRDLSVDKAIFYFNEAMCDGTVFQSYWSREQCMHLGLNKKKHEIEIINAPDPKIFFVRNDNGKQRATDKLRLIATSWSSNPKKGFDLYSFLDEHLDFQRYEMTFVGNSLVNFKNIQHISPLQSVNLAEVLREHDIFITASEDDPCSNSLLEALHCGLPVVALDSGGHPELIGEGGRLFSGKDDVLSVINNVAENFEKFRGKIRVSNISEIAAKYYDFCVSVHRSKIECVPTYISYLKLKIKCSFFTVSRKLGGGG